MTDDAPLKSAVELAMERLRQRDEQAGVEHRPLTGHQKAAIAEIRTFYQAKIAEQEVLHQSRLGRTFDPAERETLEAEWRSDRERRAAERDAKIEDVRRGETPSAPSSSHAPATLALHVADPIEGFTCVRRSCFRCFSRLASSPPIGLTTAAAPTRPATHR